MIYDIHQGKHNSSDLLTYIMTVVFDIWSFGILAPELAHGHAPVLKYHQMKEIKYRLAGNKGHDVSKVVAAVNSPSCNMRRKKYPREENAVDGYGNDMVLSDNQTLDWTDRALSLLFFSKTNKGFNFGLNPTHVRWKMSMDPMNLRMARVEKHTPNWQLKWHFLKIPVYLGLRVSEWDAPNPVIHTCNSFN